MVRQREEASSALEAVVETERLRGQVKQLERRLERERGDTRSSSLLEAAAPRTKDGGAVADLLSTLPVGKQESTAAAYLRTLPRNLPDGS